MAEKKEERSSNGNSFGIASVILGILSIIFVLFVIISPVLGILGIIFAIKQKKINKNKWSTAGLVLSIIGLVLSILFLALIIGYVISIQKVVENCLNNPNSPGCADLLKYMPPNAAA